MAHKLFLHGATIQQGMGTDDDALVRIIATRCEVDMIQIKQEFQKQFGKTLDSMIEVSPFFLDCRAGAQRMTLWSE